MENNVELLAHKYKNLNLSYQEKISELSVFLSLPDKINDLSVIITFHSNQIGISIKPTKGNIQYIIASLSLSFDDINDVKSFSYYGTYSNDSFDNNIGLSKVTERLDVISKLINIPHFIESHIEQFYLIYTSIHENYRKKTLAFTNYDNKQKEIKRNIIATLKSNIDKIIPIASESIIRNFFIQLKQDMLKNNILSTTHKVLIMESDLSFFYFKEYELSITNNFGRFSFSINKNSLSQKDAIIRLYGSIFINNSIIEDLTQLNINNIVKDNRILINELHNHLKPYINATDF